MRMVVFGWVSIFLACLFWVHTGAQYSATEYTNESAAILNVSAPAPHPVPINFVNRLFLILIFCVNFSICGPYVRDQSKVIPRCFGAGLCCTLSPSNVIFIVVDACLLFRWKIIDSVFCGFGLSLHFLKYRFRVSRSSSSVFSQFDIYLSWYAKAVSSAYWNLLDLVLGISCTYRLKIKGASTEPWGKPLSSFLHLL